MTNLLIFTANYLAVNPGGRTNFPHVITVKNNRKAEKHSAIIDRECDEIFPQQNLLTVLGYNKTYTLTFILVFFPFVFYFIIIIFFQFLLTVQGFFQ